VRGNYCTLNPIDKDSSTVTLTNGNLNWASGAPTYNQVCRATIAVTSGKWYWEVTPLTTGAWVCVGVADAGGSLLNASRLSAGGWYYSGFAGNKLNNGANTAYGATFTNNDVIGAALDMDTGSLTFYKNGASQGVAYSTGLAGKSIAPSLQDQANDVTAAINFGQRAFAYTAPSGFKALVTTNLPTPTISNGANYMAATLYTGNGSTLSVANTVNGVSFQPDLVWLKGRSVGYDNFLYDSVRGVLKSISSNLTTAEQTISSSLTAFNADGFTLGGGTASINNNGTTYVGWQWNAGGSNATNTSGTITSTVRANTTSGFSIVTYDSNPSGTVGHGLGAVPKMIIEKKRDVSSDWLVGHSLVDGSWDYLRLNLTDANANAAVAAPTSTVFTPNASGDSMVAYCFAEVPGYSAFGRYTGNGSSTDGPFVYTGFRPRFILLKSSSLAGSFWNIVDTSRSPNNIVSAQLYPNSSAAEGTTAVVDVVSNGFKIRTTNTDYNSNTNTYIYAAFAEVPTKFSLAR
jgi:hypothetical protein